jgi:hypothetical protein
MIGYHNGRVTDSVTIGAADDGPGTRRINNLARPLGRSVIGSDTQKG